MKNIALLGNFTNGHVGSHLAAAARAEKIDVACIDSQLMYGRGLLQKLSWHYLGRRPLHQSRVLGELNRGFADGSLRRLLVVGLVPLPGEYILGLRNKGIRCGIFLTDDPFNPGHRSNRMLATLPAFDVILTPRRSIVRDLQSIGARRIERLPFAYDPATHVAQVHDATSEPPVDVMFVGGADPDRIPFAIALIEAGFSLALYGGFWDRDQRLRPYARGLRSASEIRCAARSAKLQVILARRANRDGHVMRTYEAAASRSCLIVEETDEHREIFGEDGHSVNYFTSPSDLVARVRALIADDESRDVLANRVFDKIVLQSASTYADRLRSVQEILDEQ